MKKMKTTIISLALYALCAEATAQTVTVADVEALPGETVALTLNLTGGKTNTYTAMQFDVQFPTAGFTTTGSYSINELWPNAMAIVGTVDADNTASIPVASSETIGAADVEGLLSVSFTVGGDVPIGEYDVTLKNLWFGYGTSSKDYLDDVTFKVKVVAAHTVVLDETSAITPEAATGVNVRVKRTISANQWSTICLPFAMSEAQVKEAFGSDVQLGDFTGYETTEDGDAITGINVKFTAATAIEANHPYIIKVSQAVSEFTADGVDIDPDEAKVEYDNGLTGKKRKVLGSFVGTYVADFDFYNDAENYPLFLSGNKFYYATENTKHMKAFRGYFDFVDYLDEAENAEARVFIVFGNDTTGIGDIQHETTGDDRYYNLGGQRVEQPSRGLYIKNGKKVMIK